MEENILQQRAPLVDGAMSLGGRRTRRRGRNRRGGKTRLHSRAAAMRESLGPAVVARSASTRAEFVALRQCGDRLFFGPLTPLLNIALTSTQPCIDERESTLKTAVLHIERTHVPRMLGRHHASHAAQCTYAERDTVKRGTNAPQGRGER